MFWTGLIVGILGGVIGTLIIISYLNRKGMEEAFGW